MRSDIFDVARHATEKGCRVVLATCGHLLSPDIAKRLKESGVMAVSVSLDSASAELHDDFRGVPGAFEKTLAGLEFLKGADIPFQINTTVSKINVRELPAILSRAIDLGASTLDLFFLVPTGRGSEIADLELDPEQRDQTLGWIADQAQTSPIRIKTTCAPQYKKFIKNQPSQPFRGCMGGRGFVFISNTGILQPCGFLDLPCGDLREAGFDFWELYRGSDVFKNMRRLNPFAGCPARAYARTGDYMESEL
jgi:MoaA/NifB/PqqE/SkfB family radical SAM enzyme